ncbi:hypothetical protein C9374_013472 [Naegleria lovaniensis]|uniref:Uncharacterized protein n=1 Tax=Naegleria lovaniensis TaxID=51637 RepID=A0AA88KQ65_NAELO|nr:uncharacterized protein C9374_013472 [Naegleria lovaniensis]KAG2391987.1 hypothetical protein C9374_013472 [Naegleria lovaniensis]
MIKSKLLAAQRQAHHHSVASTNFLFHLAPLRFSSIHSSWRKQYSCYHQLCYLFSEQQREFHHHGVSKMAAAGTISVDPNKFKLIESVFNQLVNVDIVQLFDRVSKYREESTRIAMERIQNRFSGKENNSSEVKIDPLPQDVKARILKSLEILVSLPTPEEPSETNQRIKYFKSQALKAFGVIYSEFYPWFGIDRDAHLGFYYMTAAAKLDDAEACYHVGTCFINALNYLAGEELEPEKYNFIKSSSFLFGSEYDKDTNTFIFLDEKARKKKKLQLEGKEHILKPKLSSEEYLKYPGITQDLLYIKLKENEKLAVEYLKKAADLGDMESQVIMAKFYLEGKAGLATNLKLSMHYGEMASKQNSPHALFNIASIYLLGAKSQVAKPGFEELTAYQLHHTPNATETFEVKKDVNKAMEYYTKAASLGLPEAAYMVGHAYHHGLYNLTQNTEKAVQFLNQAVNNSHAEAAYYLYLMYATGENCEKDTKKAEQYFTTAIKLHSPNALYELGDRYFHGKNGCSVDYAKAFEFFTRAGELKNKNALYCLGVMYYHGIHVKKSLKTAFERYSQAVQTGSKEACLALSDMVSKGEGGVPRDEHYAKQLKKMYDQMVASEEGRSLDNQHQDSDSEVDIRSASNHSGGCGKSSCQCAAQPEEKTTITA